MGVTPVSATRITSVTPPATKARGLPAVALSGIVPLIRPARSMSSIWKLGSSVPVGTVTWPSRIWMLRTSLPRISGARIASTTSKSLLNVLLPDSRFLVASRI